MPQVVTIADQLLSPPVGSLRPILDEGGPYGFGDYTFTSWTSTAGLLIGDPTHLVYGTFGVIVVLNGALPASWGYEIGWDSGGAIGNEGFRFEQRFAQVVPEHELLGGLFVPMDYVDIVRVPQVIFWPWRLVGGDRLGLHVTPSISVDLYYLCLP